MHDTSTIFECLIRRGIQAVLFIFLFTGTIALGAINLAYFTGDRVDRASIDTTLVLFMNDIGLKSDQELGEWVAEHRDSPQADVVLESFMVRARRDPQWFKNFTASLSPQKRLPFTELASRRLPASMPIY